jgi:CubicO group peptidase (beta-lactamase class C family)
MRDPSTNPSVTPMNLLRFQLLFWCLLPALPSSVTATPPPGPFTAPAEQLAELVQSWTARGEIVGAELLVVHSGQPLVHRAFGYADRERNQPLQTGAYFAVRSMTKPFTGMAAQILIDEGKLGLDAPVAIYLPSFDRDQSRDITIRQLLTHRAGFPSFRIFEKPLRDYVGGLRELADLAGEEGPTHPPDSRFVYSDIGSDVLGAVVASVSGLPLEEFIRERILIPLELADTFPEREAVSGRRQARVPVRYAGVPGNWAPYWDASREPIYAFLKGSGGLFSTTTDYARFLQAWIDRDRGAASHLLTPESFARALTPASGSSNALNTGFPNAVADYGQMWTVYRSAAEPERIFAFGHGGSDGTHAYAFPEHNLVVCLFTQTRGHEAAPRFDAAMAHLFLRPDPAAFAQLLTPPSAGEFDEFTGLYARDNRVAQLGAVVVEQGTLAFEIPGRMLLRLRPTEERDRWVPERAPNDTVTFRREDGRIVGLVIRRGGREESAPRFRPEASLPTTEEILRLRQQASPAAAFNHLLPLRIEQRIEQNDATYPVTLVVGPGGRSASRVDLGAAGSMRSWQEGARVWRQLPGALVAELHGLERSEEIHSSLPAQMGDWREFYREIVVLARENFDGEEVYRVRLVPYGGLAVTKLINARNGVVVAEFGFSLVPGAGLQGTEVRYLEAREVGGVLLPHRHVLTLPGLRGTKIEVRTTAVSPRARIDPADLAPPSATVEK